MHYGSCGVVDKCLALLRALFLVIGPSFDLLSCMLSKVTSITTDFGTEVAIPDCPDILHAFLRRLQGVPMELLEGTIDPHSKLFCNAIKMPGWSHMFGNLMHYACKQVDTWPVLLNAIRVLCKFLRNASWRRTLILEFKHVYPPVVALLNTFKASLKK